MYNTKFEVKYNTIENELIYKLKNKTPQEYADDEYEYEYEYSYDDIIDICDKLYRDELLSVFGAENLTDDKIYKGMIYVYDIMMTNNKFKEIVNVIYNQFMEDAELTSEKHENHQQLILFFLFSKHLFHITHKCVCQQIDVGKINDELLVTLSNILVNN